MANKFFKQPLEDFRIDFCSIRKSPNIIKFSLHYSPISNKQISNIKYFHLLTFSVFIFLQLLNVLYSWIFSRLIILVVIYVRIHSSDFSACSIFLSKEFRSFPLKNSLVSESCFSKEEIS